MGGFFSQNNVPAVMCDIIMLRLDWPKSESSPQGMKGTVCRGVQGGRGRRHRTLGMNGWGA